MARLSWEQEARAAGEIVAYHRELARSAPQEGRIHTLAQLAGERLFAHLGEDSIHHVFRVADIVTDQARLVPVEAEDYGQQWNLPDDPQGRPAVHTQLHSSITVYGDHLGGRPRFFLLHGAFDREQCAEVRDPARAFPAIGQRWDDQWILPGMANALRRIVLLDWQALGRTIPKRKWSKGPEARSGRVARLAFAGYVFEALGVGPRIPPNNPDTRHFKMGAGLAIPPRAKGFPVADQQGDQDAHATPPWEQGFPGEGLEEWFSRVAQNWLRRSEAWSYKQVRRVVDYSHRMQVQVPTQFVPLEHLTDPQLRNLSLMQALAHLMCDDERGPRIRPVSAAPWLGVPAAQVRTHRARARAKLSKSDSARKAPTGAPTSPGPAEAGTGGGDHSEI